jgi:hypothetical protein
MGQYDSSLTRVQPVFDALREKDPTGATWLLDLWRMAIATRNGHPVAPPESLGPIVASKVYERTIPPSTAFLRWAVQNPSRLVPLTPDYGATGKVARLKRAELFGTDAAARWAAIESAVSEIDRRGAKGSGQQWWAFEGFTHADACFETPECLLLVEGKRTETVSASTRWFKQRNQLWRNVEVAGELAAARAFGVILAVETEADGRKGLQDAEATRDGSYPHLSEGERARLDRHLLGFVVWSELVDHFGLPRSVLRETR